jgi:hypothetical protein
VRAAFEERGEVPEEAQQWEEDWDDDATGDDFAKQLRSELEKQGVVQPQVVQPQGQS